MDVHEGRAVMNTATTGRDLISAALRRRAACPNCGNRLREMTREEVAKRDDMFVERRYRECNSCGHIKVMKGRSRD